MTDKYDYTEIWTAKNLLTLGYRWIARNQSRRMFAYTEKPFKEDSIWNSVTGGSLIVCENVVPIFSNIKWEDPGPINLEDIVHPQILDDAEIVFEVNDDFEPESVTEDRWGNREVHLDAKV